jgi:hypothetical protein
MRKHLIISGAALASTLVLALAGASFAAAGTVDVLTYTTQGGPNVSVGDVLSESLLSGTDATFYTSTGGTTGGTCDTGTYAATVDSNPAAGGTADLTTTKQSFSDCTDNVSFDISTITIKTPYAATISLGGLDVGTMKATLVGTDSSGNGVTCRFTASNVVTNSIFTNQGINLTSGSSECPSTLYFSAHYGPLLDSSVNGDPIVDVNEP